MSHSSYCRLSPLTTQPVLHYRCSLLILYTFSHTEQPYLHTANATLLVLNTFSTRTPDVTFLILQIFSSHHTPCLSATDVPFYSLYTFFSSCTAFFSYLRCDPPGTAHFFHSLSRCHIADTADFFLRQHTLSSCRECSLLVLFTLFSHCTILS